MAMEKSRIILVAFIVIVVAIALILVATGKIPGMAKFASPSGKCMGAPICSSNMTKSVCTSLGCNYTTIGNRSRCMGIPKTFCNNSMSISACNKVLGCHWINITLPTPPRTNITPPRTPSPM